MRRMRYRILAVLAATLLLVSSCMTGVWADALDKIENYVITADIREDASVDLTYHIEWKVLDSETDGPLKWVKIGLPNIHSDGIEPLTDNIEQVEFDYDGGAYACIYFDREYEAGEVVTFEFKVHTDYIYQIDRDEEGSTVYSFTPGWFDEIAIDRMEIRWDGDKASAWSPSCLQKDGYCIFNTSLAEGESYTVEVTYPNDAYSFNQEVSDNYEETYYDDYYDDGYWDDDPSADVIGAVGYVMVFIIFIISRIILFNQNYSRGSGFGDKKEKKITRTRVEYYSNCPNCGAPRSEGASKDCCEYCGTNLVKSEVVLKEEDLTDEEKEELRKFKKDGEYEYNNPDTFVRVHTTYIPISHHHSGGGHHGGGSGCACACASCACACACACAGGGRAGCSNKDFYKGIDIKRIKK